MTLSFARDAVRTTGEVVSYHEIRDGDEVRYRPRVRFRTATGEIVTISGQLAAASQRFEVGTQVPVVYRPAKPTEARIALFTDNWLGAGIAARHRPGGTRGRIPGAALAAPRARQDAGKCRRDEHALRPGVLPALLFRRRAPR